MPSRSRPRCAGAASFHPLLCHLDRGQIDVVTLLLITAGAYGLSRKKKLAGVAGGAALFAIAVRIPMSPSSHFDALDLTALWLLVAMSPARDRGTDILHQNILEFAELFLFILAIQIMKAGATAIGPSIEGRFTSAPDRSESPARA